MGDKSVVGPILLGAAITGATGVCLYLLLSQEKAARSNYSKEKPLTVRINTSQLGIVLGRQGSNLREIQSKTRTTIWTNEQIDGETCIFYIKGAKDDAELAEILINQTICSQPRLESCVISIPQEVGQSLLGRQGEQLKNLELKSRCRIQVEQREGGGTGNLKLTIKGTTDQISTGKNVVEQYLREQEYLLNKFNFKDGPPKVEYEQPLFLKYDEEEEQPRSLPGTQEKLRSTGSDHLVQVYVSCVADPERFWVQNIGPSSVQLDKLTETMTNYYSNVANQAFHALSSVNVGDIVVSTFEGDSNFYRAKVVEFIVNEYDRTESTVDLDFVDYGDYTVKRIGEVFEIKTEFLKLNFQAIQCKLADVRPVEDGAWSEESIVQFESLTHCAMWKPVLAKILQENCDSYGSGDVSTSSADKSASDQSKPSLVQLFLTGDNSIGNELVKRGLARFQR